MEVEDLERLAANSNAEFTELHKAVAQSYRDARTQVRRMLKTGVGDGSSVALTKRLLELWVEYTHQPVPPFSHWSDLSEALSQFLMQEAERLSARRKRAAKVSEALIDLNRRDLIDGVTASIVVNAEWSDAIAALPEPLNVKL